MRSISAWQTTRDDWPTTYDIAGDVYQVEPDQDGSRHITDAQHAAVRRSLERLQREGLIIGFRTHRRSRSPSPGSDTELAHHWMTRKGFQKWLRGEAEKDRMLASLGFTSLEGRQNRRRVIMEKARALGWKLE